MNKFTEQFEFITPCFCAGADVKHAEVRAPSIRGQLRWWFRVLGGTPEQEDRVFGGVHGNVSSSSLVVRVTNPKYVSGEPIELPQQNNQRYYLFHFARVSGNRERYNKDAWLKEGSSFEVEILFRRNVNSEDLALFERAWNVFRFLGSLGLRQTRGIGAFVTKITPSMNDIQQLGNDLRISGIRCWSVKKRNGKQPDSVIEAHVLLEAALGYLRKQNLSGKSITPLGSSARPRQASALHLRPVLTTQGALPLLFFAPQVLEPKSAAKSNDLLKLLDDSSSSFGYPYQQKAPSPDTRPQASFVRLN